MTQQNIHKKAVIIRSSCSYISRCNYIKVALNLMMSDLIDKGGKMNQRTEHAVKWELFAQISFTLFYSSK